MSEQDELRRTSTGRPTNGGGTRRYLLWLLLAAVVTIADQVTKWMIIENVELYEKISVTPWFNITHQHNPGAAFSFLADAGGWQRWFFTALATVVSIVIAVWLWTLRNAGQLTLAIGLAFVLGGAVGNLIDRVQLGYVIDFIQVLINGWSFPSFNVADAALTVGAGLLIIDALFLSSREGEQPAAEDDGQ